MQECRIVLVEDDPNVVRLLTRRFERSGCEVRVAASIAAARVLLRGWSWHVALLDRRLPDGDGLDLCGEIRAEFPHGYLIMLTGESSEAARLEGFEIGADDYVSKPFPLEELFARVRAGVRIAELQKALVESNRQLAELTLSDALTSVANRRAFDGRLADTFEQANRYDRALSLMLLDIDHFKSINDTHGHQAGDVVLRSVGEVLRNRMRGTDFVARIGGEEFGVLLAETALFEALKLGESIRTAVQDLLVPAAGEILRLTVSIGLANMPHSRFALPERLFKAADKALYRAKANGRNRIEVERRRSTRPELFQSSLVNA